MTHVAHYLNLTSDVARAIPAAEVERLATALVALRERGGRLFILGVGGSAANASHAVAGFRKLAGIETYAPTDNVPELTARTNDDGWETVFEAYLRVSRATANDAVRVLSVGGGDVTARCARGRPGAQRRRLRHHRRHQSAHVGAGKQRQDEVERIHAELRRLMPVDDVRVCYHTNQDGCACRKPLPGMLVEAARANRIDLSHSYMVGDRWRDVEAGRAAGCHTIFMRNSYAERQPDDYDAAVDSVVEASRLILSGAFSDRRQGADEC